MIRKTTRIQHWQRILCGGLAGLMVAGSVWGADPPRRSPWIFNRGDSEARTLNAAGEESTTEKPSVSLNFSNAPWERVLRDVAKKSDSTITFQNTPPGTFSRTDLAKHTRTDAVRILNRELESLGYRILTKDDHLTILNLHQARSTYRRPVSPEPATERNGQREAPGDAMTLARQRRAQLQQRFSTITQELQQRRGQVVQTAGVQDGNQPIVNSDHQTAPQPEKPTSPEDTRITESVYDAEHRSAVDLAKIIYGSFKSRSQLLDEGRNGLPAFRVYRQAPPAGEETLFAPEKPGDVWFTMEIDTDGNRLILSATRSTGRGLTNLIRRLDVAQQANAKATKLVEGTEATMHVARQLQPELGRLKQPRPERNFEQFDQPPTQLAFQQDGQTPPGQDQQPGGQPIERQQEMPSALSGLRGDVTLEAIDDLNLLILRGNEDDLRQVQEVIDRIEQLAQGTRPEIHILFLNNVNSVALAELLSDVYERLGNLRNVGAEQGSQTVNIVPIATPNAILILAPTNVMESVIGLAEELDRPGDPRAEVEIFALKSAVASQVVAVIDDFYEERVGLGARIQATADIRTNTVIVHARPNELEEVRLIIRKMDRAKSNSTNQIRVVPLQQAPADELAEFLTTTIQGILNPPTQQAGVGGFGGANQGAQELRDTKAVVLEFLKHDGNAQQLIRSGLLSDVRVTGDLRTNSLTVVAPEQTMKLMLELIHILDQPSAAIADIKVFQLQNADASAAVELLNELFATEDEDELGIAINGATDASSSLVPLTFSFDPRTNTVVAIGGLEALTIVEAILFRLDESDLRERETTVLKLRNSRAEDVALAINEFVTAQLDLVQIDPTRISTGEIIDQTYIVIAEPATNTLLIGASPRYFDDIVNLARELDMVPPQVFISSMIVEVDLLDTDEWGVELGFQDPVLFGRSGTDMNSGQIVPGFNFPNFPGSQSANFTPFDPSVVGAQGLSNFALGRTNSDLGFGGLVLSASSDSVSVLIRALKARRNIRILSAPKVHALDNQEAIIQDGQLVPIVEGVTVTGLSTVPIVNYTQTGLILSVTPRITPEGEVVMGVSVQKSALSNQTVPVFFDTTSGNTINSPIIDQTIASTSVMVDDGQTVVLGGIIVDGDTVGERKVPYLGDLPYIGHAFRYDSHTHARAELLVFLTPHIIHNDADFELVKQVETERLNFFEHEAEEVHGPLFSVPRPQPEIIYDGSYPGAPYDMIDPTCEPVPTEVPNAQVVPDSNKIPYANEVEPPAWNLDVPPQSGNLLTPSPAPTEEFDKDIQTLP